MTDTAHLPGCVASQRTQPLLDFWGKASPTNHAGIGTHSIVYHSLDVAAVGAERARGRTQNTPRDRIPISKASSLQSHRQMGVCDARL